MGHFSFKITLNYYFGKNQIWMACILHQKYWFPLFTHLSLLKRYFITKITFVEIFWVLFATNDNLFSLLLGKWKWQKIAKYTPLMCAAPCSCIAVFSMHIACTNSQVNSIVLLPYFYASANLGIFGRTQRAWPTKNGKW